ncbi:MAG TPA: hypothetical protein VLI06_17350 [Solimonas sp.]|nr:hypothetical protein [Solimonas sp.]
MTDFIDGEGVFSGAGLAAATGLAGALVGFGAGLAAAFTGFAGAAFLAAAGLAGAAAGFLLNAPRSLLMSPEEILELPGLEAAAFAAGFAELFVVLAFI